MRPLLWAHLHTHTPSWHVVQDVVGSVRCISMDSTAPAPASAAAPGPIHGALVAGTESGLCMWPLAKLEQLIAEARETAAERRDKWHLDNNADEDEGQDQGGPGTGISASTCSSETAQAGTAADGCKPGNGGEAGSGSVSGTGLGKAVPRFRVRVDVRGLGKHMRMQDDGLYGASVLQVSHRLFLQLYSGCLLSFIIDSLICCVPGCLSALCTLSGRRSCTCVVWVRRLVP